MYNSKDIANRIKQCAKEKNVALALILRQCDLGVNTIGNMSSGRMPAVDSVAKIADYLDVSVDYLLGRTKEKILDKTISDDFLMLVSAYKAKPEMQSAVCQLLGVERPANETAETTKFPPFTGRLVAADGTNIGEAVPNTKKPKIRTT